LATELEIRHAERRNLFRILVARHQSKHPGDFKDLLAFAKSEMEPEDVKLVLQEFEEWKNS
jgi:hypothetical protein